MKHLLKTLVIGSAFALTMASQAMAQTKVIIGHFGDPAPYKAIVADGTLEKATGWTSHKAIWAIFLSCVRPDRISSPMITRAAV